VKVSHKHLHKLGSVLCVGCLKRRVSKPERVCAACTEVVMRKASRAWNSDAMKRFRQAQKDGGR
jgi:hypothetical protein